MNGGLIFSQRKQVCQSDRKSRSDGDRNVFVHTGLQIIPNFEKISLL